MVKPSEKEPETVRAITVNKPERSVEDTNELLRKLVDMLTPGANTTIKAPEPSTLDKLVHLLTEKVAERKLALLATQELTKFETKLQSFLDSRRMPNQEFRQRPVQRDWSEVKCFSAVNRATVRPVAQRLI